MKYQNLSLALCLLCGGCGNMLKTEYHAPEISFPSSKNGDYRTQKKITRLGGGDVFKDPILSKIIEDTIKNNNDLHAAALRLEKGRLESGEIDTGLLPDFSMSLGASSSRLISQSSQTSENYSGSISMSYEIDLWGKLARTRERAKWNIEASIEDLNNTRLLVIESISKSYWSIAKLNEQIIFNQQRLEIAESTYKIVKAKYESGAGSKSDVLLAEKSLFLSKLQLRNVISQRWIERNTMATVYNRDGFKFAEERTGLGDFQRITLPLYQPVEIVSFRPDVKAAEINIRSALSGYDVAKTNFFPSISLGATLSAGSSVYSRWFSEQTLLQSISAVIPILQWRKLNYQLMKEKITVELAVDDFRKTVLKAIAEVETALETRNKSEYALDVQRKALSLSQEIMRMNTVKYKSGFINFQTLLDSQDDVLNQRISYLDCQYDYLLSTMKFFLSIGGDIFNKGDGQNGN